MKVAVKELRVLETKSTGSAGHDTAVSDYDTSYEGSDYASSICKDEID